MVIFITFLNMLGVRIGKAHSKYFHQRQNAFAAWTDFALRFCGAKRMRHRRQFFAFLGGSRRASRSNRAQISLRGFVPTVTAASGAFGLFVALWVSQVGSLFSADAWNNIGFTAAEVKNPKRDVALSMAFGTIIVITLYCLANLAYLFALPLHQIQNAPDDRVASAALKRCLARRARDHGRWRSLFPRLAATTA